MPKKRANGEGSIRKRKDGRWEGRYTAGNDPTTGKPIHKSVLAKTQSEAKEKLKQAIAEAEKLDMSRAKSYTLGAWIKLWYEVYAEPRLREKTKDYYLNYIDNHIIPELGNTPLEKLTTIQIQKFYNDLQKSGRIQRYTHIKLKDKGLSTRVVRGIHTLLNNCLEQAVAERLLLTNPAKGCRLPKLEKREIKILPEDKIGPYLAEAERRGLLAAFYLELTTGLRRGELLALLWTDLDVENMTKAERLEYGQSLMTHAMVFQGVNLDENGKPNRWRVENSWGEDACKDGYYVMTDEWFNEYTYQIVVNKKYLSQEVLDIYASEPTMLEPWDPMGSLAE